MRHPKTFLITDTHFGHENIIKYCNRPFQNAHEMNKYIIDQWVKHVMPEDMIFHLGDVAMNIKKDTVASIIHYLPGKKILIKGNHDNYKGLHWWTTVGGFDFAADAIVYRGVYLTHKPASVLPEGCWINVHGHLHNLNPKDPLFNLNEEWVKQEHANLNEMASHQGGDKPFNKLLCLEKEDYKPVLWDSWVGQSKG